MKHAGQYALAGLLVLATVPIYHFILTHRAQGDPVASVPVRAVHSTPEPPSYVDCRVVSSAECSQLVNTANAFAALREGRAKCVAGVVYRTADHVIEPWPGKVACDDPYGFRSPRGV